MLTKDDLKQIRSVVREEVETEVGNAKQDLESKIFRLEIHNSSELTNINNRLKNSEIRIKQEIKKVYDKLDKMDMFLDKEVMADRKRIVQIEERLGFPQS